MNFIELTLPSIYASYLINGDSDGYTESELADMQDIEEEFGMCFDVNFDTLNFQQYNGIGHEVCEFIFVAK